MNLPTLVYRTPGNHQCAGGTYAYRSADTPEELDLLLEDGWFLSLPEAIAGEHNEIHYGGNKEEGAPAIIVVDGYQAVNHWLINKLIDAGIEHDGILHSNDELLGKACSYAAEERLQAYKEAAGLPAKDWLLAKAEELKLNPSEELSADELLFLICHEYAKPAEAEAEAEAEAAPSREELETKAVELGIAFDGRTTDKRLAEKIELVLAEQEQ